MRKDCEILTVRPPTYVIVRRVIRVILAFEKSLEADGPADEEQQSPKGSIGLCLGLAQLIHYSPDNGFLVPWQVKDRRRQSASYQHGSEVACLPVADRARKIPGQDFGHLPVKVLELGPLVAMIQEPGDERWAGVAIVRSQLGPELAYQ